MLILPPSKQDLSVFLAVVWHSTGPQSSSSAQQAGPCYSSAFNWSSTSNSLLILWPCKQDLVAYFWLFFAQISTCLNSWSTSCQCSSRRAKTTSLQFLALWASVTAFNWSPKLDKEDFLMQTVTVEHYIPESSMGPKMSTRNIAIWWTFVHYILSCSKVKLWHVQARAEQRHLCWTFLNFIELLDNCLAPKLPVLSSSSQVTVASSVSKARTRGWANSWILAEFTGISFLNRRQTLQLFLWFGIGWFDYHIQTFSILCYTTGSHFNNFSISEII